jgi:hypothetical protein
MAFMGQEKKAKIAVELKKVVPKDWKYSLAVHNHSTICLTISAAPVDLVAANLRTNKEPYLQLNEHHLDLEYAGELLEIFQKIKNALNLNNYDNSDVQTDYFDVGHYVDISIGHWNRPFKVVQAPGGSVPKGEDSDGPDEG